MVRILAAALFFGAIAAIIKGDHGGVRDTIGNLSAPWLFVALIAGLHTRSLTRGALLGLAATVMALLGFYLVVTVFTDDQLPTLREHLEHVLWRNRRWLLSGLASGPLFGAIGAAVRRRAPDVTLFVAFIVGLLLLLEPVVIAGARIVPGWRQIIHWTLEPIPYVVEAVLGCAILLFVRRRSGPLRSRSRGTHGADAT